MFPLDTEKDIMTIANVIHEEVEGSALGRYAISQVISALEWRRKDRLHMYRKDADPDIRLSLRDDERIRQIELVVKHDEPKRIAKAQALKAAGSSAGTFAIHLGSEIFNSTSLLCQIPTPKHSCLQLRSTSSTLRPVRRS